MRRLVVCADGTWNRNEEQRDGGGRTNVAWVYDNVLRHGADGTPQLAFYDAGVGSGRGLDKWFGGAFGTGISRNIRDDCYGFLVRHYQPGDQLFLFGFSRGAYTVRSLAGMVRKCGILRRSPGRKPGEALDDRERAALATAYDFYRDRDPATHPREAIATEFRRAHSHEAKIHFLGVWDTVGSLGVPTRGPIGAFSRWRHRFHDVQLSSHVLNAFHAVAIDERRRHFAPSLWEVRENDPARAAGQWRVEQRWFAGGHCNVGGGYPDRGLSHLALQWIAGRAESCGLEFGPVIGQSFRHECDCGGARRDEMERGVWKLFGEQRRDIGRSRVDPKLGPMLTFEDVDVSVPERCARRDLRCLDRDTGYRPENFLAWWARNPGRWPQFAAPAGTGMRPAAASRARELAS